MTDNRAIKAAFEKGTPIDRAMNLAFFEAVRLHRRYGVPMALWEEGEVRYVNPHEIALPEERSPDGSPAGSPQRS